MVQRVKCVSRFRFRFASGRNFALPGCISFHLSSNYHLLSTSHKLTCLDQNQCSYMCSYAISKITQAGKWKRSV